MKIRLVKPDMSHSDMVMGYKKDFFTNNDQLHGTSMLDDYDNYEEWYASVVNNLSEETVAEGWVPATTLLAINEDGTLVGMINIRHRLNDYLHTYGGHIGYSVHPEYRRKGVATQMLTLAKDICRNIGIDNVLVTCDKNNIASSATIRKCSGVLENEITDDEGVIHQRYFIKIR